MKKLNKFNCLIHQDAKEFRHKKIKEVFSKSKNKRDDFEVIIIIQWINHYGERL